MIEQGVWTSKDGQRTMTVKYDGYKWVDIEEHNQATNHCQQLKVGEQQFSQFKDQLIVGGWTFNKRQRNRRSK